MTQWGASIGALYPDCDVLTRCNINGGCGGFLGPVSDAPLPDMYARYIHLSCCPTGIYPVAGKIIDGNGKGRNLVVDFNETPEKRGYICYSTSDCSDAGTLYDESGVEVPASDLPACVFGCDEEFPPLPVSTFTTLFGCDDGTDPETDVVAILNTDTLTITYYTVDVDGGLEDYTLVGKFLVDCETELDLCDQSELVRLCKEVISVEKKCGSMTEAMTEQVFIGSDADGANGYTTWEAALGGQTPVLDVPGPLGSTSIYTGSDYTVEHVGYLAATPLASLPRYSMTVEAPASQ